MSILERMSEQYKVESKPAVNTAVVGEQVNTAIIDDYIMPTSIANPEAAVISPKLIKDNNPGTPLQGYSLQTIADEFGKLIEIAMHKAGVSSVGLEVLGDLFVSNHITPRNFRIQHDQFINKSYLVSKAYNRDNELHRILSSAINSTVGGRISFPYEKEVVLELPERISSMGDITPLKIKSTSLFLTHAESKRLKYSFIQKILFNEKKPGVANEVDYITFEINREEWAAAPYRETITEEEE